MKNLSLLLIISVFSCKSIKKIRNTKTCENVNITFKINVDTKNSYNIKVKIVNNRDSILMLSTPFKFPIVRFRIFDKNGIEFFAPKIKFSLNSKSETNNLKSHEEISGFVNVGINTYKGLSDINNWHKIIAYYYYYSYKNCNNVITDTLINIHKN